MSHNSDGVLATTISIIFGFLLIVGIALYISYFLAVVGAVVLLSAYAIYYDSSFYQEKQARRRTQALYEEVRASVPSDKDPVEEQTVFCRNIYWQVCVFFIAPELDRRISQCVIALSNIDFGVEELAKPPVMCNGLEGARYRDQLRAYASKLNNTTLKHIAEDAIRDALKEIVAALPATHTEEYDTWGTVQLHEIVGKTCVHNVIASFFSEKVIAHNLFASLRKQMDRNMCEVSGMPYSTQNASSSKIIVAREYKGDEPVAYAYLNFTPLALVFSAPFPITIPQSVRFKHHWLIAPTGSGKTNALSYLLNNDLDKVALGKASVIVMDSSRDFITSVSKLGRFASGGDLEGRLVFIDVEDTLFPIALNLFDLGVHETDEFSPRDKEVMRNSTISMMDYVLRSVLGAELTSRQSTLFNFSVQLLLEVPEATLDRFIDLMKPHGQRAFEHYIKKLEPDVKRYFDEEFDKDMYKSTKNQVIDRLYALKRNRTLSRMFSSPTTKLNLYEEMSAGKVILVNSAKSLLQSDGVEIFGRFFLALILLSAEKRQLISMEERLPTFLYLDEAQDVIANDEKLPTILDQARKLKIGAILSHQRVSQLKPFVSNALLGSTAIKMASGVSASEASLLSKNMGTGTTARYISEQPPYHFATYISGLGGGATSLSFPEFSFDDEPQMSVEARREVIAENRRKFCSELGDTPELEPEPLEEAVTDPLDDDGEDFE